MEDNEGVVQDYLNALVVAGVSGGVSVGTGAGLVAGGFYRNSAAVSVTIPTPVTDPRIDRIVLQKLWLSQTTRIARVAGTEAGSPSAPTLTQTDAVQWEAPLAQVLITTAGVITVTDEREFVRTPLAPAGAMVLLDSIVLSGGESGVIFFPISQIYKHLLFKGQLRVNIVSPFVNITLNEDANIANYNNQRLQRSAGAANSLGTQGTRLPRMEAGGNISVANERSTQFEIKIPNYTLTTFFKNIITDKTGIPNDTPNNWSMGKEGSIWLNADAVTRVDLKTQAGATFKAGTQISLYGLR